MRKGYLVLILFRILTRYLKERKHWSPSCSFPDQPRETCPYAWSCSSYGASASCMRLSVIWNPSTHSKALMTSTPWSPVGKSLALPASGQLHRPSAAVCSVTSLNLNSLHKFLSLITRLSNVKRDEVNSSIDNQK
ncbi:uncharacterized protein LOC126592406 [Malus sylvestris]|uniref:uncharacterized protein LOC126592406 n=1 Tax=Malus sylvestris TaxID=3752 RepID=UPI0021AD4EAF|nr:uncharacterized protein LOC126592406 [Malus sylvestris]